MSAQSIYTSCQQTRLQSLTPVTEVRVVVFFCYTAYRSLHNQFIYSAGVRTCAIMLIIMQEYTEAECRMPHPVGGAMGVTCVIAVKGDTPSGGFRGGCIFTPLWRLVMYFAHITARVYQMIMQQWHAPTTTRHSYTLTYQFLTDPFD